MSVKKTEKKNPTPKQKITAVGKVVEKLEPLCTAGGNVKWYSHCGKQYSRPQKN